MDKRPKYTLVRYHYGICEGEIIGTPLSDYSTVNLVRCVLNVERLAEGYVYEIVKIEN